MLYLLYGEFEYLIDKEITKILKDNIIDEIDISKYDLDAYNYKDILEDASTISMFSTKKAIIVNHAIIFDPETKVFDFEAFEQYFNNMNPDTILIFKLVQPKINNVRKVTKLITKLGVVKDFNKDGDINSIVSSLFGEYKISKSSVELLTKRVGTNIYQLTNEIEKIKLYKDSDLNVTDQDILELTSENSDTDLFKLIDAIVINDKEQSINAFEELLRLNMEPFMVVVSLADKFRLIYQVKELSNRGYKQGDIASELKLSPGYVYYLMQYGKKYNSEKLLSLIKELADLDFEMKTSAVDKKIAFELFILKK